MAEILFYHLTETTLDDALPGLLERTLQRGWKAVVQTAGEERRDALDARLWTFSDGSFLAHGTDREPHARDQPVCLTATPDNPNGATVRFMVEGAPPPSDIAGYDRIVLMFDGHDPEQVERARAYWKDNRAAGHALTYWQQTPDRRWERKA